MRALFGILGFVALVATAAWADQWDDIRFDSLTDGQYSISSGTGFFVAPHIIVTNEHVVQKCTNIAVRGSIEPTKAHLLSVDKELDLALLHVQPRQVDDVTLTLKSQIGLDDMIYIAGYPLDRAYSGRYIVRTASVVNLVYAGVDNFQFIEFTDMVEQGHSGSPILDTGGNVVGIVTSKVTYKLGSKLYSLSRGIDVSALAWFLQRNRVEFNISKTGQSSKSLNKIERYIVNIHCIKEA